MIFLGSSIEEKKQAIAKYCSEHGISKVKIFSPKKFDFEYEAEHIEYADIIRYIFFYRMIQEIDGDTLVVINECLRTQNRHELTYNCLRNFLNQTKHQLIFQYLPLIDTFDDFMTLFDFDTRSQWKRDKWSPKLLSEIDIRVSPIALDIEVLPVETDENVKKAYAKEKTKLIEEIGLKDPHTIPRNLYLMSGKARLKHTVPTRNYLGRNNRFKIPSLKTYREDTYPEDFYTVFEFCHNFIDFSDFLALSRQTKIPVLVADLKVDQWYLQRYLDWVKRIQDAYAEIHG
jgi:hypothetical protein